MSDDTRISDAAPSTGGLNKPWECPRCGTINAWWVARCRCKPKTSLPNGNRWAGWLHG